MTPVENHCWYYAYSKAKDIWKNTETNKIESIVYTPKQLKELIIFIVKYAQDNKS